MRLGLLVIAVLLSGCSGASTGPTPPPTPPARTTSLWVIVLRHDSGECVPDATIEIIQGPGRGKSIKQNDPCSYWDPDFNSVIDGLIPGLSVILRASAPGYEAAELTVVPLDPHVPSYFELRRL